MAVRLKPSLRDSRRPISERHCEFIWWGFNVFCEEQDQMILVYNLQSGDFVETGALKICVKVFSY